MQTLSTIEIDTATDDRKALCKAHSRCLDAQPSICKPTLPPQCRDDVARRVPGRIEGVMTSFDKREEGFEKKFALDEEQKFKAIARRNKMLGLWAAQKLGKAGVDANTYAKDVVMTEFEADGDEDVFRKLQKDLAGSASDAEIRSAMTEFLAKAAAEVKAGK
jgi:hypothetical protein